MEERKKRRGKREKEGGDREREMRGKGKRVCNDGRRERVMATNNTSGLLRALQMAVASCSIMASLNSSEPRSRVASTQHCVQDVNIMYTPNRGYCPRVKLYTCTIMM